MSDDSPTPYQEAAPPWNYNDVGIWRHRWRDGLRVEWLLQGTSHYQRADWRAIGQAICDALNAMEPRP